MPSIRSLQSSRTATARRIGRRQPNSYQSQVRRAKRCILLMALHRNGWSYSGAARELGVSRTYLHRLVSGLDLREAIAELVPEDR